MGWGNSHDPTSCYRGNCFCTIRDGIRNLVSTTGHHRNHGSEVPSQNHKPGWTDNMPGLTAAPRFDSYKYEMVFFIYLFVLLFIFENYCLVCWDRTYIMSLREKRTYNNRTNCYHYLYVQLPSFLFWKHQLVWLTFIFYRANQSNIWKQWLKQVFKAAQSRLITLAISETQLEKVC